MAAAMASVCIGLWHNQQPDDQRHRRISSNLAWPNRHDVSPDQVPWPNRRGKLPVISPFCLGFAARQIHCKTTLILII
jgi:hypothetical protein